MIHYPIIYSIEEQEERNRFAIFFQTLFKLCDDKFATFPEGLNTETLYRMYKAHNPNTIMTESMIAQQVSLGGYINKKNKLMCSIIPSGFTTLPMETQIAILDSAPYDKTLNLRQQVLGMNQSVIDKGNVFDLGLRRYLLSQCFTNQFKYWGNIPAVERRTALNELFIYYVSYCGSLQILSLNRGTFYKSLQELGYIVKKGYCGGTSGITYLDKIIIPKREDREESIKYGFGVIDVQGKLIFNDGMLLEDMNAEQLKIYLEARKVGVYGQSRKKETEEKEQHNVVHRDNEDLISITSIREEELYPLRETEEADGVDAGINPSNAAMYAQYERTIGGNNALMGSVTASTSALNAKSRSVEITEYALEHASTGGGIVDTRNVGNDRKTSNTGLEAECEDGDIRQECSSSRDNSHRSTEQYISTTTTRTDEKGYGNIIPEKFKRELFSGLRVTYRINPGTFDLDKFVEECEMSGCPMLPLSDLEILYKEFIGTIKK